MNLEFRVMVQDGVNNVETESPYQLYELRDKGLVPEVMLNSQYNLKA